MSDPDGKPPLLLDADVRWLSFLVPRLMVPVAIALPALWAYTDLSNEPGTPPDWPFYLVPLLAGIGLVLQGVRLLETAPATATRTPLFSGLLVLAGGMLFAGPQEAPWSLALRMRWLHEPGQGNPVLIEAALASALLALAYGRAEPRVFRVAVALGGIWAAIALWETDAWARQLTTNLTGVRYNVEEPLLLGALGLMLRGAAGVAGLLLPWADRVGGRARLAGTSLGLWLASLTMDGFAAQIVRDRGLGPPSWFWSAYDAGLSAWTVATAMLVGRLLLAPAGCPPGPARTEATSPAELASGPQPEPAPSS